MKNQVVAFYNRHSVAFNIVSLLIAIGSLCFAVWVSKQPVTLPSKELSCITTSSKSLVLMLNNDKNLKLLYGEREVTKPCITSIIVQNTGAYPITNTDFLQPFSIVFGETDEILSINIGECSNQYIREEIVKNSDFSNQRLNISSFLLNPGEMFTVDIISDGSIPLIRFDQRLEGISKLNLVDNSSKQILLVRKTESANILSIIIMFGLIALIIILAIVIKKSDKQEKQMFDRLEALTKQHSSKE